MNIRQAVHVSDLRVPNKRLPSQVISADEITDTIFARAEECSQPFRGVTAKDWQASWLVSEKFILLDLPLHLVAVPHSVTDQSKVIGMIQGASENAMAPIVVDMNKRRVGQTAKGFYPPVIVVDGVNRHKAVSMQGRETIRAWVGQVAAARLGLIHADHQFGASELQSKLQEKLREKFKPNADGMSQVAPGGPYPWIKECYPFENYFVYTYDGDLFKQKYKANQKKREVVFVGEPEEVVEKYVGISASGIKSTKQLQVGPIEHSIQVYATGTGMGNAGPGTSLGNGSGAPKPIPSLRSKKNKLTAGGPGSGRRPGGGKSKTDEILERNKVVGHDYRNPFVRSPKYGGGKGPSNFIKKGKSDAEVRRTAAGSGYIGYRSATKTMSDKTKGGSKSEMASKLNGQGYSGYSDATEVQRAKTKGASKSEMFDKLKGAAHVRKIITDYKKALKAGYKSSSDIIQAVAPPGMEHMVKGLKKHFGEDSSAPFKIAWWRHGQSEKGKK